MFNKTVLTLLTLLIFTGCSSSNDPKEIAIQLCEDNKAADYEAIKNYASDELKAQLDELTTLVENLAKTKEGRELIQKQKKFQETINCKESTLVTKIDDTNYRINNDKAELNFTLKMQNGSWKMFR